VERKNDEIARIRYTIYSFTVPNVFDDVFDDRTDSTFKLHRATSRQSSAGTGTTVDIRTSPLKSRRAAERSNSRNGGHDAIVYSVFPERRNNCRNRRPESHWVDDDGGGSQTARVRDYLIRIFLAAERALT